MAQTQTAEPFFFRETKPAAIRLWHWLAALFFACTIITVLFASTLFKMKPNVAVVQEQVQRAGGTITEKQAFSVAHEYSDKLWMLHKWLGYGLSILLLWRIIAEVTISKEKKLSARIKKAISYPDADQEKKHYMTVQYSYLIFYGLFILMALTGLVLAYEDVEWLKPIHEPAEQVHNVVQYGLYGFILFHIVGVIRADLGRYGGIVSRMINGK
ncbi:cytochrome b/b6 domain-containing protein [Flavihumibacter profundi]|uniref:cytochrome b/b6 domain-containing protein n=1 Tax=Flavihumibacter profundi TaxID=2716883 RepID=UPI001CC56867|nr:cytochrome b/b6 domain-containing protein [Flavihumibacter profundi]MBZ5856904.1 cytochrome b/b6 domain-containing protein [Flavihumibacter profundi]